MRYYTSDNHFAHAKIIEYCKRPFADVNEMNAEMVRRWNEVVTPEDEVWHLGDFAFGTIENVEEFRKKLHGDIYLVAGNHDKKPARMEKIFGAGHVFNRHELNENGLRLVLTHKPRGPSHNGFDYCLNGHVHEKWRRQGKRINVGVDQWDFRPVTLDQLIAAPQDPPCTSPA